MKKIGLLVVLMLLFSCKTKKITSSIPSLETPEKQTAPQTPSIPNTSVYTSVVRKIMKKTLFDQVRIQSIINAELEHYIPPIDAIIYIENNKKIWVNFTSLFIPVARGLAEPNSVKAYEKIKKTYIDSDYAYLNQLMKVDFINYQNLQSILLGQLFFKIDPNEDEFTPQEGGGYKIMLKEPLKMNVNNQVSLRQISLICDKYFRVTSLKMEEKSSGEFFEVQYSNWVEFEKKSFPQNVKIIINAKKTEQILIENTKFDFSKSETPYVVPNNYKKTVIK